MPRPGPRPYECVRRAWHSDRHQPIRGSLIQEIFRVVNEIHSPATKKNKEWQEKLPVVVLKAEEILYSKANSEAEYMDLKTLWERTNDAINTIIRRDESLETGDLLQPCIEAALNLGCTPRRASRSQRNSNPRFYLSPVSQEPNSFSPPGLPAHNTIQPNHVTNLQCRPDYTNFMKSSIPNPPHSASESQNLVSSNGNGTSYKFLLAPDNTPSSNINQWPSPDNYHRPKLCSVYPLHYGLPCSVPFSTEPEVGMTQNFFCSNDEPPAKASGTNLADTPLNPKQNGCDLSLRLGFSSASLPESEKRKLQNVEMTGYDSSLPGSKLSNQMQEMGFDDQLHSCLSKSNENADGVPKKKCRTVFDKPMKDQQFCWQPKLPCEDG
ncbi:hypothetical protein Tsubulata_047702 [Turnera subulata]|uniref:Histone acetyltransferase n=1 Tax=Turnera subulata TaxID=218843 RepID=A0A9Q0FWE3_9ROSI|nr:hypothetical protein Tsubulata_047702 [Turnera subulata]